MTDETNETNEPTTDGESSAEAGEPAEGQNGADENHLGARARRRAAQAAGPREGAHPERTAAVARQAETAPAPRSERLDHAEAERIDLRQGSIRSATAQSITVNQGAIGGARADVVSVTQGALGGARAQRVSLEQGALGAAIVGDLRVRQGFVQAVIARNVSIEQGGARSVLANHVTFSRQSGALFVIARSVEGEGRTLVDWRGAVAFGAAFGLASAFLRQRLRGR